MALTKVSYSMIDGEVTNILDFIPQSEHAAIINDTSTYDCGPAIQTAIEVLKGNTKRKRLYFPKGVFRVYTGVVIYELRGFVFQGESTASVIRYMPSTGSLFYITNYQRNAFYDLSFISNVTDGTQTNTCFRLNGTDGGTELLFQNCYIQSFNNSCTTIDAVGNDDTVTFNSCYFYSCRNVWDNTNTQAVSWTFNECQMLYNYGVLFNNPGGFLRVFGGTYINPGTFVKIDVVTGAPGCEFDNVKFETTQNFTPPGTPKWLVIGGVSAFNATFRNCSDKGGGTYSGVTWDLRNNFNLSFYNCEFINGQMQILSNYSLAGETAKLIIQDSITPIIVETLLPSQANTPSQKLYRNAYLVNGSKTGFFSGQVNQRASISTTSFDALTTYQKFTIKNISIGSSVYGVPFDVPVPVNSSFTLCELDFRYQDSSGAAAVITLYTSSAKTTKIFEYSKGASPGVKLASANISTFLNNSVINTASSPLYIEVVPAGNIDIPTITFVLRYMDLN